MNSGNFLKLVYKNIDMWIFFSKFCGLLFFFCLFYYFWHCLFNFVYMYFSKNSENFYVLLFYGLEILSKIFGKLWNIFLKNIDIWNPKLFSNSIIYYLFFFILLTFLTSFFPISPNQTCQKNSKYFCGALLYRL